MATEAAEWGEQRWRLEKTGEGAVKGKEGPEQDKEAGGLHCPQGTRTKIGSRLGMRSRLDQDSSTQL